MLYIANPKLWFLSCLIVIFFIIWKYIVSKYFLDKYKYPNSYIIFAKKHIWITLQYICILWIASLPLDISYQVQYPAVDIILDNSVSMSSEDLKLNWTSDVAHTQHAQTRIDLAKNFIESLYANDIEINNCTLIQSDVIDVCKKIDILSSSWSSVTDALLLSLQKPWKFKVVLSDWWLNEGIELDQIINNSNNNSIYRIDFYPRTWNIIISWQIVADIQTLELIDSLKNHFITNNSSEEQLAFDAIKNAALSQHFNIHLNYIFVFLLLIFWSFFSYQHMKKIIWY